MTALLNRRTAMNTQEQKRIKMITQPVERLILKLALPTITSMLVTQFYNMVDTFFIGKMNNTSATGAVGVVFSAMALIQAIAFLFGFGSGNFMSRLLGKKDVKSASEVAAMGFVCVFAAGVIIAVLGHIFLDAFANLLGSTDTILPYAKQYLSIILLGAPFIMSSFALNNQLRFQGNAIYAMVGIVSGAIINIGLDPVFIFVFNMGIRGAALATVIGQLVSFCLLWCAMRKCDAINIEFKNFKPSLYYLKEIIGGGLPSLLRQGIAGVATMCLNHAAAPYGDAAIAAFSVVQRFMMFTNSALIGFGQGFQPVCGFNYGAGEYGRVRRAYWFSVKVGTVFLLIVGASAFVFAPQIITLFRNDPEVIAIGTRALRVQCCTFPLGALIVMSNMMLQTTGKTLRASILALSRQGSWLIPAVMILPKIFALNGAIAAQPTADVLSFLLAVPITVKAIGEMK